MFSDRLKEARIMRHMTQSDLSAKVPILSPSTISNYEKGKSEPDMYRLSRLIEALDVDANFLLQDEMSSVDYSCNVLTCDEQLLISQYRTLDAHGRTIVDFVLKEEAARMAAGSPSMMAEQADIARQRYGSSDSTCLKEAE